MTAAELHRRYTLVKRLGADGLNDPQVGQALAEMAVGSLDLLREADCVPLLLRSAVASKTYFSYQRGQRISRPINTALFINDPNTLLAETARFNLADLIAMPSIEATRLIYTIAMAFCAATDVTKDRDKQTPATYFANLIAHVFAITLGVNPQTEIEVLAFDGERTNLPTDYIFDLGPGLNKIHLPVKTSTRERVIQAWAHQRILEQVYGAGAIKGVLVTLTETKLDRESLVVTEICLPEQWKIYQRFIAHLDRVYYLDPPATYVALAPRIVVKPLGEMFAERAYLIGES